MPTSKPSATTAASRRPAVRSGGFLLVLGLLLGLVGSSAPAQESAGPGALGTRMSDPGAAVMHDRIELLREENAQLRRRVQDLQDGLTRLDAQLPHVQAQLRTRIDGLEQHLDNRTNSLQDSLSLYMRVGTFVLILIGVFGFGYVHQMLRGIIENAVNSHLRSDEFSHNLGSKVEQVADESRESILEASKEETRQLTRRLIDEFLTEERTRIEEAIADEQDALKQLRGEHLDLQSPVSQETGEYLERVASAVHDRSLELLTDEEIYYAMLDADAKSNHLEAERYARELLRRHPSTADSLSNLAWILEHTGRVAEAEAHYKRALEADPGRDDVARYFAFLLDTQGRHQEARSILEKVLEHQPSNPRAISHYANFLVRHGATEEGRSLLNQALADHPNNRNLLTSAARLANRTGQSQEARSHYRRALEAAPDDQSLLMELAQLELAAGNPEAAREPIERALEVDPESVGALELKGRYHLAADQFGEAETTFRQALTNDGESGRLEGLLALALLAQGRRAEATDMYHQAHEHLPDPGAIDDNLLQPLRDLSAQRPMEGSDELTAWLEAKRNKGGAEPPQDKEANQK